MCKIQSPQNTKWEPPTLAIEIINSFELPLDLSNMVKLQKAPTTEDLLFYIFKCVAESKWPPLHFVKRKSEIRYSFNKNWKPTEELYVLLGIPNPLGLTLQFNFILSRVVFVLCFFV